MGFNSAFKGLNNKVSGLQGLCEVQQNLRSKHLIQNSVRAVVPACSTPNITSRYISFAHIRDAEIQT